MLRVSIHRVEGGDNGEDQELLTVYIDETLMSARRCSYAVHMGLAQELHYREEPETTPAPPASSALSDDELRKLGVT